VSTVNKCVIGVCVWSNNARCVGVRRRAIKTQRVRQHEPLASSRPGINPTPRRTDASVAGRRMPQDDILREKIVCVRSGFKNTTSPFRGVEVTHDSFTLVDVHPAFCVERQSASAGNSTAGPTPSWHPRLCRVSFARTPSETLQFMRRAQPQVQESLIRQAMKVLSFRSSGTTPSLRSARQETCLSIACSCRSGGRDHEQCPLQMVICHMPRSSSSLGSGLQSSCSKADAIRSISVFFMPWRSASFLHVETDFPRPSQWTSPLPRSDRNIPQLPSPMGATRSRHLH